jgi:hypothetical protein
MTFNVISLPVKPEYISQKLNTMKRSVLLAIILLLAVIAQAQQPKISYATIHSQILDEMNDFENNQQTISAVNPIKKHTVYAPGFTTEFSEITFDPIQFNTQLSAFAGMVSNQNLMLVVRETLSYNGTLMLNSKKYNYITGMTGNGFGVKLRL